MSHLHVFPLLQAVWYFSSASCFNPASDNSNYSHWGGYRSPGSRITRAQMTWNQMQENKSFSFLVGTGKGVMREHSGAARDRGSGITSQGLPAKFCCGWARRAGHPTLWAQIALVFTPQDTSPCHAVMMWRVAKETLSISSSQCTSGHNLALI